MFKTASKVVFFWLLLSLSLPLGRSQAAPATTIHVPGDHPTIVQALAVATVGDTVQVASGTYFEGPLTIPAGVSLIGAGWQTTQIDGGGVNVILYPENDTLVEGFTLRNTGTDYFHAGIWIDQGMVTLRENRITATATGVWA